MTFSGVEAELVVSRYRFERASLYSATIDQSLLLETGTPGVVDLEGCPYPGCIQVAIGAATGGCVTGFVPRTTRVATVGVGNSVNFEPARYAQWPV